MIALRAATPADVRAWYGTAVPPTLRAIVAVKDGRPLGIAGLRYDREHLVAFSEIADEMRPYRKAIVKATRMVVEMARRAGVPVYAFADQPTSDTLLRHFGFAHVGDSAAGDIYMLGG